VDDPAAFGPEVVLSRLEELQVRAGPLLKVAKGLDVAKTTEETVHDSEALQIENK
jgi:hypothetical protein